VVKSRKNRDPDEEQYSWDQFHVSPPSDFAIIGAERDEQNAGNRINVVTKRYRLSWNEINASFPSGYLIPQGIGLKKVLDEYRNEFQDDLMPVGFSVSS
jgi:hypothetical protein